MVNPCFGEPLLESVPSTILWRVVVRNLIGNSHPKTCIACSLRRISNCYASTNKSRNTLYMFYEDNHTCRPTRCPRALKLHLTQMTVTKLVCLFSSRDVSIVFCSHRLFFFFFVCLFVCLFVCELWVDLQTNVPNSKHFTDQALDLSR